MTQSPYHHQPNNGFTASQGPSRKAKKWPWIVGAAVALLIFGLAVSGNSTPPAPAPPTTPATTRAVDVALPEVAGRNGKIVLDELRDLGLINVIAVSQDRHDTVVVLPENWTGVAIEPSTGTTVKSDSVVVVTMTKRGTIEPAPAPEPPEIRAPEEAEGSAPEPEYAPEADGGQSAYYPNCSAAKAAGAAPLYAGEPGYSSKLDRDSDGIACES